VGPKLLFLACAVLLSSLQGPPAGAEEPAAPQLENVIRWATSSEVDNFGYDVYRADAEQGPYARITPLPIPGHGTTDLPQRYEFRDDTIAPDTVYYYYVESISLDGTRERFTPISRSRPKSIP
jgi:hypothetical protein